MVSVSRLKSPSAGGRLRCFPHDPQLNAWKKFSEFVLWIYLFQQGEEKYLNQSDAQARQLRSDVKSRSWFAVNTEEYATIAQLVTFVRRRTWILLPISFSLIAWSENLSIAIRIMSELNSFTIIDRQELRVPTYCIKICHFSSFRNSISLTCVGLFLLFFSSELSFIT